MSESHSTEPDAVARNVVIVSTILTGLMVFEYAWNFRFEVQVIWRWGFWKRAEATIFVIARYVGLAGQIFNIWVANWMAAGIPRETLSCRAWFTYIIITNQTLTMSVEVLLMLRVCAMYGNDRYVLGILFIFAGAQSASMAIAARMVVPSIGASPTCMVVGSHPGQIYVGTSTVAVHLCVLAMILWRYFRGNWTEPLRSYLKITVRDSICTVIVVTGGYILTALTPMGLPKSQTSKNIHFHVTLFLFWFAAGRLVLDKEKFRQEFKDILELTEIDLEHLGPSDYFDMPATLSDSKVVPTEIAIAVDHESRVGMEEDIADKRVGDDASPSGCLPIIMRMETGNRDEGSGSRK